MGSELYSKKRKPWELKPVDKSKPGQGRKYGGNQAFYRSKAWRCIRALKLAQNPFCECEICKKNNLTLSAEVVDHHKSINPIDPYDTQNGRYGEPLDLNNLRSMTKRHHNKKSAKEAHK